MTYLLTLLAVATLAYLFHRAEQNERNRGDNINPPITKADLTKNAGIARRRLGL